MTGFVRTVGVVLAQQPQICARNRVRPSALWAFGDQHGCGVIGVLTDIERLFYFPAGGGAVRGPGGATVPYPEQVVNVRRGFGGDNVWNCW